MPVYNLSLSGILIIGTPSPGIFYTWPFKDAISLNYHNNLEILYCSYFIYEKDKIPLMELLYCLMAAYASLSRTHTFCNMT